MKALPLAVKQGWPRPNIRVARGHFEIVLFVPTGCANVRLITTTNGHGSTPDFSLRCKIQLPNLFQRQWAYAKGRDY
jgi:hypothetical protein